MILIVLIAFLLKLCEKHNTSATYFIGEKLGLLIDQDRKMYAKKLQNVLLKDENFQLNDELRMILSANSPVSRPCQKFECDETLSKYISK